MQLSTGAAIGKVLTSDATGNGTWGPSNITVTAGTGLSGGGAVALGGTTTLSLPTVGTAGTYGSATQVPVLTTDAQGRVTGVTNTAISAGTVTSVTAGTGLDGGIITASGTISLPNTGTAGTYGSATQVPVLTTDAQGRVTGVTNTTISAGTGTVTNIATGPGSDRWAHYHFWHHNTGQYTNLRCNDWNR